MNRLLDAGLDTTMIPATSSLISASIMRTIFPTFGSTLYPEFSWSLPTDMDVLSVGDAFNEYTGSIYLGQITGHHFYLGICLVIASMSIYLGSRVLNTDVIGEPRGGIYSHLALAVALGSTGSVSITYAHHSNAMAVYPLLSVDYPTVTCIFVHHMWIGGFLITGAASHATITIVRENINNSLVCRSISISDILNQRDIIVGHLVFATIFLGMHSFGVYVHNDSMLALGRMEDIFCDNSMHVRPIFSSLIWETKGSIAGLNTQVIDGIICYSWQELGTGDFMLHHIHAFTIHVTVLIQVKGILYSRTSRLVSDKSSLDFRYPCDGPGRGGTCQVSGWDHIFLSLFWMYNSVAIVIFHFYWKMQADIWGTYDPSQLQSSHITGGDFSGSITVNSWLTQFLWSQAGQVIQSYGTSISAYGFLFLGGHFV